MKLKREKKQRRAESEVMKNVMLRPQDVDEESVIHEVIWKECHEVMLSSYHYTHMIQEASCSDFSGPFIYRS
jgi:hypothetical protein